MDELNRRCFRRRKPIDNLRRDFATVSLDNAEQVHADGGQPMQMQNKKGAKRKLKASVNI